jgi:hypothetical protein
VHGPLGEQGQDGGTYVAASRPGAATAAAPGAEATAAGELTQVGVLQVPWVWVSVMHEYLSIDS